jgi:tRNA(Ile)-lysidine synthase
VKGDKIAIQPPSRIDAATPSAASFFESKLNITWPPDRWRDVTVLIAVSGGADSVALVRGLHVLHGAIGGDGHLLVAHFNHCLRGAASDADEAFVRSLAEQLGLRCIVGRAATDLNDASGDGLEAAARQARYDFLARAAGQLGARYVATAHTADDQVETVLFNILRGTGLSGLAGIPRTRQLTEATTIIRPILDFKRADILDYLAALGQSYCDDETNQLTDYTRNRIRHDLLPQLERDYNPRVRDSLLRLSQAAAKADDFLSQQAKAVFGSAARRITGGVEIELKRLIHLHPAIIRQMLFLAWQDQNWPLQDMSFEKWERLAAVCRPVFSSENDKRADFLPGGVRIDRTADSLRLTRN